MDVRDEPLALDKIDGIYDGTWTMYRQADDTRDTVMTLTDTRIRNAKPSAKAFKLSDGGGMYLLVKPDGGRYWRLDYRFAGKRRTLALGIYPTLRLSDARTRREEARRLLVQNLDPGAAKKATKRAARLASENTFEAIARDWLNNQRRKLAPRYYALLLARLEADTAAIAILARFGGGGGTTHRVVALASAAAKLLRAYSEQVEVLQHRSRSSV